jgi:hypothetical protein
MKRRGGMELINTELVNTEPANTELVNTEQISTDQPVEVPTGLAESRPGEPSEADTAAHAPTDLDATLARTLRRFIAEVSKADQHGKRAAHMLLGRRDA